MRILLAGAAGGMAMNLAMLLTFRMIGFGSSGRRGILLNPSLQSPKLIAVWTTLEPLPLVVTNPLPIILGIVLFGIAHAYLYRGLARAWPVGMLPRAARLAGLVFTLSFLFWEFFTPYNQFGEPLTLIALEMVFWAIIAAADGLAIAAVMEWGASNSPL